MSREELNSMRGKISPLEPNSMRDKISPHELSGKRPEMIGINNFMNGGQGELFDLLYKSKPDWSRMMNFTKGGLK